MREGWSTRCPFFMRIVFFGVMLAATPLLAAVVPVPTEVRAQKIAGAKPRNVIFILADDHRYDAMSFMGHPLARTPQLDYDDENDRYEWTNLAGKPEFAAKLKELAAFLPKQNKPRSVPRPVARKTVSSVPNAPRSRRRGRRKRARSERRGVASGLPPPQKNPLCPLGELPYLTLR